MPGPTDDLMRKFYDLSRFMQPGDPFGQNMIWQDIIDLLQFGKNLAARLKRNPCGRSEGWRDEIDATLRASGICEADLVLARNVVIHALNGNDLSSFQ